MKIRTERLELRPLEESDLDAVAAMNADPRVMDTLGGALDRAASQKWLSRIVIHWRDHGYGRFFVGCGDRMVAVVGLSRADFDAGTMFGIEIAWRAPFDAWGKGYVTEAARAVIADGFERVKLDEIVSATSHGNVRSHRVMHRLGMTRSPADDFDYAAFPPGHPLRRHEAYRLRK